MFHRVVSIVRSTGPSKGDLKLKSNQTLRPFLMSFNFYTNLIDSIKSRIGDNDSLLRKFLTGSFWAIYGNVAIKGFSLIASVIIARIMGSDSFGQLSIIKTTLSVFSLFATFGLGVAVTKFVAESKQASTNDLPYIIKAANTITAFTGLILGILIVVSAPFLSNEILKNQQLTDPLRISAIYLFFNALNVYQVGVIAGLGVFRDLARINLVMGIITLPILLTATYLGGLNGTLWGLSFHLIINWYLNRVLIRKKVSEMDVRIDKSKVYPVIKRLLQFSYPLAIKEIIYSICNWAVFYLLLVKTDFAQVGVFNSAYQLAQLILFIPASMLNVFLSVLTNHSDDSIDYNSLIKKNLVLTLIITACVAFGVILFSGLIYQFYGATYQGGEYVLYILTVATLPMSLIGVLEQVFISRSQPGLVTVFQFIIQLFILTSAFVFFYFSKKAESLAYAMLIGNALAVFIMYFYLRIRAVIK